MSLLIVLAGILLLLLLIVRKVNPMVALLLVSICTGLALGIPLTGVMTSVNNGIGSTLAGLIMVLALGAMLGKLAEESGAAQRIVQVLTRIFGVRHIQWAVLFTGILVGIPLFYNAGFVVLIPLVFAIAAETKLSPLWVGLPMAAALSVTHGFLPPHPGPLALAAIFKASVGRTLLYGLALSLPVAILAGIVFPRIKLRSGAAVRTHDPFDFEHKKNTELPSAGRSLLITLLPVLFITVGTLGAVLAEGTAAAPLFVFLQDPTIALLLSLIGAIIVIRQPLTKAMDHCVEGVKGVSMIILIIAAGGAFKQVLIDSQVGAQVQAYASDFHLHPLFTAWAITALFRIVLGSATVAALTASGIVLPLVTPGVSPELMVLSVGAGSLMLSHVNDTGFWMFKEFFGLNLRQTFATWTVMESLISILGLLGVLLLDLVI